MDTKIAQKRVNDLVAAMLAKGMREPDAHIWLRANSEPTVYLKWVHGTGERWSDRNQSEFLDGPLDVAFQKAADFIAARPDAETAKLNEFMSSLGRVIDLGRQHGIEADYLNPLVASMKKLSENVITDQRVA